MAHLASKPTGIPELLGGPTGHFPIEADIVGYLANTASVPALLGIFAAGCVVIVGLTHLLVKYHDPSLSSADKWAIAWFILTGSIHLFFEGYFSVNHARMAGMPDLFGQMWKEYSWSDSRYLTSDAFVLCMETVTAFLWGPLSWCVALMVTSQHPLRYPFQALISTGQIYGDVLYYATSMFDHYYKGIAYCRPEAYYFWGYYFFLNFIWIVIPSYFLYDSFVSTARAFQAQERESKRQQVNGSVKKSA